MTPLYLLRHGPTVASQSGAPVGRMDVSVTREAEFHWLKVKRELMGFDIQKILTSDLQRARLHAQDFGKDANIPCLVMPDLAEQAFGDWDGLPWDQVKGADSFLSNPVQVTPPGGESFARCASRSLLALQGVLEADQSTLVLAHGGSLRAILAHFFGLTLERALDLAWQPFGLTKLEVYASNRALLRYHNRSLC